MGKFIRTADQNRRETFIQMYGKPTLEGATPDGNIHTNGQKDYLWMGGHQTIRYIPMDGQTNTHAFLYCHIPLKIHSNIVLVS